MTLTVSPGPDFMCTKCTRSDGGRSEALLLEIQGLCPKHDSRSRPGRVMGGHIAIFPGRSACHAFTAFGDDHTIIANAYMRCLVF